jgi:mRNA-degrading endonuclease RelE of RelBE toxin-antitoxin system
MKEKQNEYRYSVEKIRVIFFCDGKITLILKVGYRGDVYK